MSYTKRELIAALSFIDDEAYVQIKIIETCNDDSEIGTVFDIESVGISGGEGIIVGYSD